MRKRTQALLFCGAAVDAAFPATVIALDFLNLDVHPMRNTLSLHALRPGFPWMGLAFVTHAAALALLAWALHLLPPRPWAAPTALLLAAAASLLLAIFPADVPGTETARGHLHEAFAPIAFIGITAGALLASDAQRRQPAWKDLHETPRIFAWALAIALAVFGVVLLAAQFITSLHSIYGITERFVVVGIGGWVVSTAVQGARAASRAHPRAGRPGTTAHKAATR